MAQGQNLSNWINNIGGAINNIKGNNTPDEKGLFGPSKNDLEQEIADSKQQNMYVMVGAVLVGALALFMCSKK